jgi:formimidoylglutamate deiminase
MIFADKALLPTGWADNVRIEMSEGLVSAVQADAASQSGDTRVSAIVPGMPNVHSHAFQRGHAG